MLCSAAAPTPILNDPPILPAARTQRLEVADVNQPEPGIDDPNAEAASATAAPRSVAESTEPPALADSEAEARQRERLAAGYVYALLAYGWWGALVPIYFWWLKEIPALQLVAHRVVWGLPLMVVLLTFKRRWPEFRAIVRSPGSLGLLVVTTALIAINWLTFIIAVSTERTLQASLGYYINPLVSVAMGMIFLQERLRPLQWIGVALAGIGVGYLTWSHGSPPWLSLILAFSFGSYGLLRKKAKANAIVGLSVEMTILFPVSLIFVWFVETAGRGALTQSPPMTDALVLAAGLVTIAPLLCFTEAARRLPLSTVGFLQYIAPTGQFLVAVLFFGEALTPERAVTFAVIWLALALYSFDLARHRQRLRAEKRTGRLT